MKEKTTLYHVHSMEKIEYFCTQNKLILSEHKSDNKYAGDGMYFWDNRGNADYWVGQKLNYFKKDDLCLLVVSIEYNSDNLLDLMDNSQLSEYQIVLSKLKNIEKINMRTLGEKVDFLCNFLGFKIVRFATYYPRVPKSDLIAGSYVNNKNKVIYCVKPNHCDIIKTKHKEVLS